MLLARALSPSTSPSPRGTAFRGHLFDYADCPQPRQYTIKAWHSSLLAFCVLQILITAGTACVCFLAYREASAESALRKPSSADYALTPCDLLVCVRLCIYVILTSVFLSLIFRWPFNGCCGPQAVQWIPSVWGVSVTSLKIRFNALKAQTFTSACWLTSCKC